MRGQCGSRGHLEVKCHLCLTAATIFIHSWIYENGPTSLGLTPEEGNAGEWRQTGQVMRNRPRAMMHVPMIAVSQCYVGDSSSQGTAKKSSSMMMTRSGLGGISKILARNKRRGGKRFEKCEMKPYPGFKREVAIPRPLRGCLRGFTFEKAIPEGF